MSMISDEYVITCDNCYREWDGNAQCPCGLDNLSEDEEISKITVNNDLNLSPISNRFNSPTPNGNLFHSLTVKDNTIKKLLFYVWKRNTKFKKLYEKRYDILSNEWFTKQELNDYYGDNYIWNQQSPEILYIKNDLLDIMYHCKDLPITHLKLLIDTLFRKIY